MQLDRHPATSSRGAIFAGYHAVAAALAPRTDRGAWSADRRAHPRRGRSGFSFPFGGVPLASLGISQVGGPLLGSRPRSAGSSCVTWVVFQLGVRIACRAGRDGVRRHRANRPDPHRCAASAFAAVIVVVGLSFVCPSGSSTVRPCRVAAVQGGGEQGTSALDVPSMLVTERTSRRPRTIEPDPNLDLVLWPENAIDVD